MVPRRSEGFVRRGPTSLERCNYEEFSKASCCTATRYHRGQLFRHPPLRFENCECCVTVFNSSVENRVEKLRSTIENALQHGAYCSLHKSCASASHLNFSR